MAQDHWRVWICPFGCASDYSSSSGLRDHLHKIHTAEVAGEDLDITVSLSSVADISCAEGPCPLCHNVQIQSSHQYQSHIGNHLEQMALFVLPTQDGDDDDHESTNDTSGSSQDNEFEMQENRQLNQLVHEEKDKKVKQGAVDDAEYFENQRISPVTPAAAAILNPDQWQSPPRFVDRCGYGTTRKDNYLRHHGLTEGGKPCLRPLCYAYHSCRCGVRHEDEREHLHHVMTCSDNKATSRATGRHEVTQEDSNREKRIKTTGIFYDKRLDMTSDSFSGSSKPPRTTSKKSESDQVYHNQKSTLSHQHDLDGPTNFLTADNLRRMGETPSMSSSIEAVSGHGCSEIARNSMDPDDMTIFVKGMGSLTIGNAKLDVRDGAEIAIRTTGSSRDLQQDKDSTKANP